MGVLRFRLLVAAVLLALILPASASAARVVYVTGEADDSVTAFTIAQSGSLGQIAGSPFAVGDGPRGVAMSPDGTHLYTANGTPGKVAGFNVSATGALSPMPGSPFTAGGDPYALATTPDGTHLYAANEGSDNVTAYSVAANGSLTQVTGSPFATEADPLSLAATPDGRHLYVAGTSADKLTAFSIGANGALTTVPGSPFPTGNSPNGVAASPDGSHLFVANGAVDNISSYVISPDGSLSATPGSPFMTGDAPQGIAVSPDGTRIYTPNFNSANVSAFTVSAGALTPIPGTPTAAGGAGPSAVAMAPNGKSLYVANINSAALFAFGIVASGAPVPVLGSPFTVGTDPDQNSVVVSPDQGPTATFTATTSKQGVTSFNGSASSDPDGSIATYAWDFGDGETLPSGGPTPEHQYAKAGTYTATLTVTDDESCSTTRTFTGQTVSCNGGPQALATKAVDSGIEGARLTAKGTQKQNGKKIVVEVDASAREAVTLEAKGKIKAGKKSYALKKVTKKAKAGTTKALKLKLKKSSDAKKVSRALGGKVTAPVQVKFTDDAGNVAKKKKTVKLK